MNDTADWNARLAELRTALEELSTDPETAASGRRSGGAGDPPAAEAVLGACGAAGVVEDQADTRDAPRRREEGTATDHAEAALGPDSGAAGCPPDGDPIDVEQSAAPGRQGEGTSAGGKNDPGQGPAPGVTAAGRREEGGPRPTARDARGADRKGSRAARGVERTAAAGRRPPVEHAPNAPGAYKSPQRKARRPADPVRTLLYQHRALCARAVDPLDIAAGLEAAGVTDRTAARYRHRDVFSLAEEMYARTQRAEAAGGPRLLAPGAPKPLRHLLPAALAAAVAYTAARMPPAPQALTAAAGTLTVAVTLHICLKRGPLGRGRGPVTAALWLLTYAVFGDWLLAEVLSGGDLDSPPRVTAQTAAAAVALTAAALPLACTARWFAARAHGRLAQSRDLAEFAAHVRPLLAAALVAATLTVAALQLAGGRLTELTAGAARPGIEVAATALGLLLFLARLLAAHGQARSAAAGLNAAAAALALAVLLPLSARLPGLGPLGRPVELLVSAYGLAAVPAAICTAAALALLTRAATALTRASAHRKEHIQMTADTTAAHPPHTARPAPEQAQEAQQAQEALETQQAQESRQGQQAPPVNPTTPQGGPR